MKTDIFDAFGMHAIITKGVGGLYTVRPLSDEPCEVKCRARGVLRHEGIVPTPGDEVIVAYAADDGSYVIDEICERENCLIRPPVANLTHIFVVVPAARPAPDLFYTDKLTVIADALGIGCSVIVNKCDSDPERAAEIAGEYRLAGFTVFETCAVAGDGCADIKSFVEGLACGRGFAIAALAGVSGAGKSSLTKAVFPDLSVEIGDISRKTERGRHTTRAVELYEVGERVFIADTPGFSMLDFERFDFFEPERLVDGFREFAPYIGHCRYAGCTHTKEDGCAVIDAVERGEVSRRRHESFVALYDIMKKKPDWLRRQQKKGAR